MTTDRARLTVEQVEEIRRNGYSRALWSHELDALCDHALSDLRRESAAPEGGLSRAEVVALCEEAVGLNARWTRKNSDLLRDMVLRSLERPAEGTPKCGICGSLPLCAGKSGENGPCAYIVHLENALEAERQRCEAEREMHVSNVKYLTIKCEQAESRAASAEKELQESSCICKGNWRLIVNEERNRFGKKFRDEKGDEWTFYGLVHADDDYYYGMYRKGEARLLSCVGSIEGFGFTLIDAAIGEAG